MKVSATAFAVLFLVATGAQAADPAVKCEAGKLKESSKYAACRLKADAKAVKKGEAAVYGKCESKFADKWAKTELKAGTGICPSESDQVSMDFRITTDAAEIATLLAGGVVLLPSGCGNGVLETAESCDGADLGGQDCTDLEFTAAAGLACTSDCRLDASGCETATVPSRFRDNGDGTATEIVSGLMWELKDSLDASADAGNVHDADNTYDWTDGIPYDFDGTAATVFLAELNSAPCFAGHCDWRLPTINELRSLLPIGITCASSCVDPDLPGDTASSFWSSTTIATNPGFAWGVSFGSGSVSGTGKTFARRVRAVRGGL
ncbi:MAG: hypothetical protein ACI841_004728 [Planctomycetota bacterium]|jgi:hypothetical protein